MVGTFRLHTPSGDELHVPVGSEIVLSCDPDGVMTMRTDVYVESVDVQVGVPQVRGGRPAVGTMTGSSSPVMSSTSSGGNGWPQVSVASPSIPERAATDAGTVNGSRGKAEALPIDSILAGAGDVFRRTNRVCEHHSRTNRDGASASAIASTPDADLSADSACCSAASASCPARSACSRAASTSSVMRLAAACSSVLRSAWSFFASLRPSSQPASEPAIPTRLMTAGTSMISSLVGGDGVTGGDPAPSDVDTLEPTEEMAARMGSACGGCRSGVVCDSATPDRAPSPDAVEDEGSWGIEVVLRSVVDLECLRRSVRTALRSLLQEAAAPLGSGDGATDEGPALSDGGAAEAVDDADEIDLSTFAIAVVDELDAEEMAARMGSACGGCRSGADAGQPAPDRAPSPDGVGAVRGPVWPASGLVSGLGRGGRAC